jgi:hypothetical protein
MNPGSLNPLTPQEHDEEPGKFHLLPQKKRAFVETMVKAFGNISQSCNAIGINRRTYYNWMESDPIFHEIISGGEFEEMLLDFAESQLVKNIAKGDIASTIFLLKTKGKKRGYVERTEIHSRLDLDKTPSWFDQPQLPGKQNAIQDIGFTEIKDAI